MNPRSIILILLAVLFAGGTAYVANNWLNAQRAALVRKDKPEKKVVENQVLVAKVDLPAGTLLKPDHLRWQGWPESSLPKAYIIRKPVKPGEKDGKKALKDAVVRKGIAAGEPITLARVAKPGEHGFLAAVLHPNMRAIAVRVSATTAAAGFIFPGDRVDVLLTHKIKRGQRASETLFTNVRVLAIDQRTSDQNDKAIVAKTVSLEVSPKGVEIINVARTLGTISLSLRALPRTEMPVAAVQETTTVMANESAGLPADVMAALGTHLAFETGWASHCAAAPDRQAASGNTNAPEEGEGPTTLISQPVAGCEAVATAAPVAPAPTARHVAVQAPKRTKPASATQEPIAPSRGTSHTGVHEVSRVLGWKGPTVTIVRGGHSSTARVGASKDGTLKSGTQGLSTAENDEAADGGQTEELE